MSRSAFFTILIGSFLAALPAVAQQTPATAPAATQPAAEKPKSAADIAFEPIAHDFKNLFESLRNQGGIAEADRPMINAMRDRVAGFRKQFPNDMRGAALELTFATWLKEDEQVDKLYADLMRIDPSNAQLRHGWIQRLKSQNRFTEAVDILQRASIDPAKDPKATLLLSDCLFSDNRFQESLDALNSIPAEALDKDMEIKFQADQARKTREEYVGLWAQEQSLRQQEELAGDLPQVVMVTSRGTIKLELFENQAPNTATNFISLADKGFYDGTKFHRVEPMVIQGGDPNTKEGATGFPGQGNPGYYIPDEYKRDDHRNHFAGSLAMARTNAPNSAGCQFYITPVPAPQWNGNYCVFGRVIDGLDVVRKMKKDDVIQSVTVVRKRPHEYVPSTLPLPGAASTQPSTAPATAPASAPASRNQVVQERPESRPSTAPAQPAHP